MEQLLEGFDGWDTEEQPAPSPSIDDETLLRYQRQFLVHSFLYYKCDSSIIADSQYDQWCKRLVEVNRPGSKYYELCKGLDSSGSGYYIKDYPPEIISTALHLLYRVKKPNEPFEGFIGRWGYQLESIHT